MAKQPCPRERLRRIYRPVSIVTEFLLPLSLIISRFVHLIRKYLPHSLLHFEDFGIKNARRFLDKYKEIHTVFNDDM